MERGYKSNQSKFVVLPDFSFFYWQLWEGIFESKLTLFNGQIKRNVDAEPKEVPDKMQDIILNEKIDSSFAEDGWMEREIVGLDKVCDSGLDLTSRFITMILTNLVTETVWETSLTTAADANTVHFKAHSSACLPREVTRFFTSSCA